MQPRNAPRSVRVTNAPRFSAAPGTAHTGGSGRPARCASSVARASSNSAARSAGVSSGSAMVGFPPADGVRAVQLLVYEYPGQLVRERQAGQTPRPLGGLQDGGRECTRAADREGHVPALLVPARRPVRELLGGPLLSRFGQRDEARALGQSLEDSRLVLHFPLLDPHAAHRDDTVAHQAYIPRSRCIAATRSTATMYEAMRVFTLYFSVVAATSLKARTMMLSRRRFTVSSSQK